SRQSRESPDAPQARGAVRWRRSTGAPPPLRRLRHARRAVEKSAHDLRLLADIDQKRVMPVIGLKVAISDIAVHPPQNANDLLGLITRVQPVRSKADHQKSRVDGTKRVGQFARAVGKVEVVFSFRDVKVGICIESRNELGSPIAQIALYLKI